MRFLQEHGFSEFGKGQLTGKMELLKEGFSDSTTNHLEQQFDSRISTIQVDPSSFHDVKLSRTTPIEANSEDSKFNRRKIDNEEISPVGSKTFERQDGHNTLDQGRGRKYLTENNRWNIKNDDESSWISRIRKLADV